MKTVLLLRHAKSKQGPEYATDFERPLAKRGKRDAARVGEFVAEHHLLPDLILSSPAERARDTAQRFVDAADYQGEVRFEDSLYFAGDEAYLELIGGLDDSVNSVLLIGHNPDIAELVETLSGEWARMPTAALARIEFDVDSWPDVGTESGHLAWVQSPREI